MTARVGQRITTAFGPGVVHAHRQRDGAFVVRLAFGATAYLQADALARPGDRIAVGVPAACLFNPRAFLQPSAVRHLPRPRRPPSTSEGVAVVDQPPFPLRSLSSPADVSSTAIADEDQKGDRTICAAARIQRAARHKAARGLTTDAARLLPRRPPSASEGVAVVGKPSFPLLSPSPPTDESPTAMADEDQKEDRTIRAASHIQRAARHKAARGITADAADATATGDARAASDSVDEANEIKVKWVDHLSMDEEVEMPATGTRGANETADDDGVGTPAEEKEEDEMPAKGTRCANETADDGGSGNATAAGDARAASDSVDEANEIEVKWVDHLSMDEAGENNGSVIFGCGVVCLPGGSEAGEGGWYGHHHPHPTSDQGPGTTDQESSSVADAKRLTKDDTPYTTDKAALRHATDSELEAAAAGWIVAITGATRDAGTSFAEWLRDGTVLCDLVNTIRPGVVRRIDHSAMPFKQMENIGAFLRACRALGCEEHEVFEIVDLFEQKDVGLVVHTVFALGAAAQAENNTALRATLGVPRRVSKELPPAEAPRWRSPRRAEEGKLVRTKFVSTTSLLERLESQQQRRTAAAAHRRKAARLEAEAKASAEAAAAAEAARSVADAKARVEAEATKPPSPAAAFKFDLTASEFDTCTCGRPKAAHVGRTMECPGDSADEREDGATGRQPNRFGSMKASEAAEGTYQTDVMAVVFGACEGCGQPKTTQTGAALTCPATASAAATEDDATAREKAAAAMANAKAAAATEQQRAADSSTADAAREQRNAAAASAALECATAAQPPTPGRTKRAALAAALERAAAARLATLSRAKRGAAPFDELDDVDESATFTDNEDSDTEDYDFVVVH